MQEEESPDPQNISTLRTESTRRPAATTPGANNETKFGGETKNRETESVISKSRDWLEENYMGTQKISTPETKCTMMSRRQIM